MPRNITVKDKILDTATRLFYQQGFNNTGINQIIAEADIAIGSLYKHYKSKNDLLCEYLEEQETIYFNNLENYIKEEKQPVKKLLKLIDYRIKIQKEADCAGCHFIKINAEIGRTDKRVEQIVREHKQRQHTYLEKIISEIPAKELPMKKDKMVDTIYLMIEGALVTTSINGNTSSLESVKDIVKQLF